MLSSLVLLRVPLATPSASHRGAPGTSGKRRKGKLDPPSYLTVSAGIAAEIEHLWSAHNTYTHIQAEHRSDTIEHRGNILWRIQTLRLNTGAKADKMNDHHEAFTSLISEAMATEVRLEEWDKCERFLLSLDDDLEIRLQFRLMPSTERTWRNLVTTYKSLADTWRMKQERDATVAAIFPKLTAT